MRSGTPIRVGRLGTGIRPGTGFRSITDNDVARPITGYGDGMNRPMTAVKGAGYTSHGKKTINSLSISQDDGPLGSDSPLEES